VSSDLVDIFLLSLVAIFNPTLLAAVTIMMLIPNPKRLMLGYLLGAYTTSITCGCVIVFARLEQRDQQRQAHDQPGRGHHRRAAFPVARVGATHRA
jgi:hypothetical protein